MKRALAVFGILLVLLVFYVYFFIISPTFVSKPAMAKPAALGANESVSTEHVEWIANEIGAYKLHPSLGGEPAVLELVADNQVFSVTITNNKPVAAEGNAVSPDIRIKGSRQAIAALLETGDINAKAIEMYRQGLISIEMLKDETTLAAKGYKAIYDALNK